MDNCGFGSAAWVFGRIYKTQFWTQKTQIGSWREPPFRLVPLPLESIFIGLWPVHSGRKTRECSQCFLQARFHIFTPVFLGFPKMTDLDFRVLRHYAKKHIFGLCLLYPYFPWECYSIFFRGAFCSLSVKMTLIVLNLWRDFTLPLLVILIRHLQAWYSPIISENVFRRDFQILLIHTFYLFQDFHSLFAWGVLYIRC